MIKQWQGLRGLVPVLKEVLLWAKCYQIALPGTQRWFVERKVDWCGRRHSCLPLRNCCSQSSLQLTRCPDQSAAKVEARPPVRKCWGSDTTHRCFLQTKAPAGSMLSTVLRLIFFNNAVVAARESVLSQHFPAALHRWWEFPMAKPIGDS